MGYSPWACKELDMTEQLNNNKLEDGFSLKREGTSSLALGSKTQYSRRCTLVDTVRSRTGRQPYRTVRSFSSSTIS